MLNKHITAEETTNEDRSSFFSIHRTVILSNPLTRKHDGSQFVKHTWLIHLSYRHTLCTLYSIYSL